MTRPEGSSKGSPAAEGERTYLLGGNWKANGTLASVRALIAEFNAAGPIPANAEVVVGAPFIHIPECLSALRSDIQIAAQNCSLTGVGAYTGETCASQLKDMGVTWVILGHSERREGFGMAGEDSELVARKTKLAIDEGLKVMFCIGEKKEERENGTTMDVCAGQMKPLADILSKEDWAKVSSERLIFFLLFPRMPLLFHLSATLEMQCAPRRINLFPLILTRMLLSLPTIRTSRVRARVGHWYW
jgi:triosephosphate isomerase